jgi:hypothetical protein
MRPGTNVTVPDDPSGQCVFAGAGEPSEAVQVPNPVLDSGVQTRDVGWVAYPDGTMKNWLYQDITAV